MFPFTKKKTPEAQSADPVQESVRQRLSETNTRLDEAVRKMKERLEQRALQLVPMKGK